VNRAARSFTVVLSLALPWSAHAAKQRAEAPAASASAVVDLPPQAPSAEATSPPEAAAGAAAVEAPNLAASVEPALPAAPLASTLPELKLPPLGPDTAPAPGASSVTPAPSASSRPPIAKGTPVRLGETTVFAIRVPGGGKTAEARARLATTALSLAVEDTSSELRVLRQGEVLLVYAGKTLIVQLFEADARAAGDIPLDVLAANVASEAQQAIESERRRSRIQKNVYSLSLVVFFGLIAFYVARKLGEAGQRARAWLEESGDRVLAIRVKGVEIATPAVLKSTALVGLGLAQWISQFAIFGAWLVAVLSRFESTHGYTTQLTDLIVSPLSQLMGRLAATLPVLVVASLAALAVFVLVRFLGLFFAGVSRRETALTWLPADLAASASVILRIAIVIAALIFAAPIVTGDSEGALGRAGAVALIAIGLAAVPLLASGIVGSLMLFGRRLRVGEHLEIEGRLGRVTSLNLLELRLEISDRSELRVPHLLLLFRSLRGLGVRPRLSVDVTTSVEASPTHVIAVLDQAAGRVGRDVSVELLSADADGVLYRVSAACDTLDERSPLAASLVEGLLRAGISLGRSSARARLA
jgi:small-conductance mechanosensitive channel